MPKENKITVVVAVYGGVLSNIVSYVMVDIRGINFRVLINRDGVVM